MEQIQFSRDCLLQVAQEMTSQLAWCWGNFIKSKSQDQSDRWQDLFEHLLKEYFWVINETKIAESELYD